MNILSLTMISLELRKKFIDHGVETLSDLARLRTSPRKCFELSQGVGIPIAKIHEIVAVALFSQIQGIGLPHSAMLVKVGIDTVEKLACAHGEALLVDMNRYNRSQPVLRVLPSLLVVERWIQEARQVVKREIEDSTA